MRFPESRRLTKEDDMRYDITIDTDDAETPEAIETGTPFTMTATRDGEWLELGHESTVIGGNVPAMLRALADQWEAGNVTTGDDLTIPVGYVTLTAEVDQ